MTVERAWQIAVAVPLSREPLHFELSGTGVGAQPAPPHATTQAVPTEGEVIPEAEMRQRDWDNILVALNRAASNPPPWFLVSRKWAS